MPTGGPVGRARGAAGSGSPLREPGRTGAPVWVRRGPGVGARVGQAEVRRAGWVPVIRVARASSMSWPRNQSPVWSML
ncbi:hypothetical protein ADK88_04615 [Streptomyces sp. NRRL F-2295]|nr:hypothetical protein ADK88_04615 [Streptomyces sp. NRRL F-2295]